jgi:hypothetical protein
MWRTQARCLLIAGALSLGTASGGRRGRASYHRRESATVSRRSSKDAGTALLVIILLMVVGVVSAIVRVWSFLADRGLIWLTIIFTVAVVAAFAWWTNRRAKQREQNRLAAIEANREAWGDAICQHLTQTGLPAVAVGPGIGRPPADTCRCHPAASRRARTRLAERGLPRSDCQRRGRVGAPPVPAPDDLARTGSYARARHSRRSDLM